MQLAELQESFKQALLEREIAPLAPWIAEGDIPTSERLAIYRNNVLENLADALKDTFPAVCVLVGEDFFRAMTHDFIRSHPPQAACLLWYGGGYGEFISAYTPAASVPYLADVARFEWAWHSACFAEDDAPLETAALESLEEEVLEALPFALRESASLVASDYPVAAIWRYARRQEEESMPDIQAGGGRWLVWRHEREVLYHQFRPAEFAALAVFAAAGSLPEAIAAAMLQEPGLDAAELLGTMFQLHILRHPVTMEAL